MKLTGQCSGQLPFCESAWKTIWDFRQVSDRRVVVPVPACEPLDGLLDDLPLTGRASQVALMLFYAIERIQVGLHFDGGSSVPLWKH